ncbi:MAG TPA: cupin domain-containing protein [Actinomycetota bacterium]|nr:cupin domain-containing protein [Actinomycetota bacterium]
MTHAHFLEASRGDTFELGIITLRLLVGADQTNGIFAMGEFTGGEGPWTVPHIHQRTEESFYVLAGGFTFSLDDDEVEAEPGSFILVQRGTKHQMRAAPGGGRLLTLWTPGGAEAMFVELSRMPADSLRDPEARKAISARFDSIPV